MMRRCSSLLSRWTKVALAVGGAFFIAEARASASCTDHTAFSFATFAQEAVSNGPRTGPLPVRASTGNPPLPCGQCPNKPLEGPCRGPSCSGNNLPEGLPITTGTNNVTQDQWNLAIAQTHLNQDERIDWLSLGQLLTPISRTDCIFHPPRHG